MKLYIALLSLVVACNGYALTDCGSKVGSYANLVVSGCSMSEPDCIFHKGSNITIEYDFTPNDNIDFAKPTVIGVVHGLEVAFSLKKLKPCQDFGFECPLEGGKQQHFFVHIPIPKVYPEVDALMKVRLQNPKGELISCAQLAPKIRA